MFDVFTIGTATRDIFLQSPFFKVLRDPEHLKKIGFPAGEAQCFALGGKIEIKKPVYATGGGAHNAAVAFARQGFKTAALIRIGSDEAGAKVAAELKKEKIHSFTIKDEHKLTAHSTILLAPNGERTILVYRGASEGLRLKEIPLVKFKTKWVYVSPGNIDFDVIDYLVNYFHKKGISIAVNPSKELIKRKINGLENILNKSKIVILNREEASYLTGIHYEDEKGIFKKLDRVVPGVAVMTDGSRGSLVSDGFNIYQAGIFKTKKIIDRTGAGDAFGSGFVAGLIRRNEECEKGKCGVDNIKYAMRLASANAASVVELIGAKQGILTKKQFDNSNRWNSLKISASSLRD